MDTQNVFINRGYNYCCFLECGKPAEWLIEYGDTPDDYTHSCTEHIGALLTDAPEHRIYKL